MATTVRTVHTVIDEMEKYLYRLGIPVLNVKMRMEHNMVHHHYRPQRFFIIEVKFEAQDDDMPYFHGICQDIKVQEKPVYEDCVARQVSMWDIERQVPIQMIRSYLCTMEFMVDEAGDCGTFMSEFKEKTRPLFIAAEERAFDKEVENMLTEKDEYNN